MKTTEEFVTVEEAEAFCKGLGYSDDIDVEYSRPYASISHESVCVDVAIGESLDYNPEGGLN